MGTRKISQLDTIADANLSGEAILPVVVSDPLIPNRKAKVNQLFKGVSQGTKAEPGLSFDLDRNTGLYQNAYDELGLGFGVGGLYLTRAAVGSNSKITITAVDSTTPEKTNLHLSAAGTGTVIIDSTLEVVDTEFIIKDAGTGPQARFSTIDIGSGSAQRIFKFPPMSGDTTTLIGSDTTQTLTNKTIQIDDDNLILYKDGANASSDRARFVLNYDPNPGSQGQQRTYKLPDAGTTVVTVEDPAVLDSTIVDTKATQKILNKTLVLPKFAANDSTGTNFFQFNTDALTTTRVITVPDLSLTLVGKDTTQTLTAKTIVDLILADDIDNTKRLTFDLSNIQTLTNNSIGYPNTDTLNNPGATNITVLEKATQDLSNKTLIRPQIREAASTTRYVTIDTTNITAARTIKFPDADATLLSTENVTVDDVNFGAGIGAANLTGRTRLQQFFYAGF